METFLSASQITLAVLLMIFVLLQHRGTSLGGAFGGEGVSYRSRRGIEKLLLRATIFVAALFLATALVRLFI